MERNNGSQLLRELRLLWEKGAGCSGGMRRSLRKCACARQSLNTRNGAFGTVCSEYVDDAEGKNTFRKCRLHSKLESRQVTGLINRRIVGSKEGDSCAPKSMRRFAEPTTRGRHA